MAFAPGHVLAQKFVCKREGSNKIILHSMNKYAKNQAVFKYLKPTLESGLSLSNSTGIDKLILQLSHRVGLQLRFEVQQAQGCISSCCCWTNLYYRRNMEQQPNFCTDSGISARNWQKVLIFWILANSVELLEKVNLKATN